MERVETLCERLKEQIEKKCSIEELLMTVQMLQSELMHLKNSESYSNNISSINIDIPVVSVVTEISEQITPDVSNSPKIEFVIDEVKEEEQVKIEIEQSETDEKEEETIIEESVQSDFNEEEKTDTSVSDEIIPIQIEPQEDEKVFMTLDLDEAAVEEELQQIKKSAEIKNTVSSVNKPLMLFDPVEEIPTLLHQRSEENNNQTQETNSQQSINEAFGHGNGMTTELLNNEPIKDLKKAISINDRYLFINELFNGDELTYDRSVKAINAFSIYPEAEFWMKRELKIKFAWDDKSKVVQQFIHLVKRRFSAT